MSHAQAQILSEFRNEFRECRPAPRRGAPDPLLLPYLRAETEEDILRCLDVLVRAATPVLESVVRRRFRGVPSGRRTDPESPEVEDLKGEIRFRLIRRLRRLRTHPEDGEIRSYRSFVAATASHACCDLFRQRKPARSRLKNRLIYILSRNPVMRFAVWRGGGGELLCGKASWPSLPLSSAAETRCQWLLARPDRLQQEVLSGRPASELPLAELVSKLFGWIGGPIALDVLVRIIELLCPDPDPPCPPKDPGLVNGGAERESDPYEGVRDRHTPTDLLVEQRDDLRRLWREVCELRLPQRRALLLNLPDVHLIDETGVAGREEIARALEIPGHEFESLWPCLPLGDGRVAELLGVTPLQVIGLRKGARERLLRRTGGQGGAAPRFSRRAS
jgi:hypothetical protein